MYDSENFEAEWSSLVKKVKVELSDDEFQIMWHKSYVFKHKLELILALEAKNIKFTRCLN